MPVMPPPLPQLPCPMGRHSLWAAFRDRVIGLAQSTFRIRVWVKVKVRLIGSRVLHEFRARVRLGLGLGSGGSERCPRLELALGLPTYASYAPPPPSALMPYGPSLPKVRVGIRVRVQSTGLRVRSVWERWKPRERVESTAWGKGAAWDGG